MKIKSKLTMLAIALLTPFTIATHASASGAGYQYSARATDKVITVDDAKLYRVTVGDDEADNQFKFVKTLPAGTYLKISGWIMSTGGGYVVKSNKYKPDANHFYFVFEKQDRVWYEQYTPKRMAQQKKEFAKIDKKYAKEKAADDKIFNKSTKWTAQDQENYVKSHPLGSSQFQYTSDNAALNAIDYDYIKNKDVNCIYENVDPTDTKALLPQGFQVTNGMVWENTATQKEYDYLDEAHAKQESYANAGWEPL